MDFSHFLGMIEVIFFSHGYLLVFISNFIETTPLGWLIPGGILVALGGFFAYNGTLTFGGVLASSSAGMLLTFLLAYLLGKKTGMKLAKRFNQEKNAERAKTLLDNHGAVILTTSLLANFTRFWISYVAGVKKYNLRLFLFYATIASLTWNALLVTVGYLAGAEREKLETSVARLGIVAWIFLFVAIGVIYWKVDSDFKKEKNS